MCFSVMPEIPDIDGVASREGMSTASYVSDLLRWRRLRPQRLFSEIY